MPFIHGRGGVWAPGTERRRPRRGKDKQKNPKAFYSYKIDVDNVGDVLSVAALFRRAANEVETRYDAFKSEYGPSSPPRLVRLSKVQQESALRLYPRKRDESRVDHQRRAFTAFAREVLFLADAEIEEKAAS
jgi:hypothetical protein